MRDSGLAATFIQHAVFSTLLSLCHWQWKSQQRTSFNLCSKVLSCKKALQGVHWSLVSYILTQSSNSLIPCVSWHRGDCKNINKDFNDLKGCLSSAPCRFHGSVFASFQSIWEINWINLILWVSMFSLKWCSPDSGLLTCSRAAPQWEQDCASPSFMLLFVPLSCLFPFQAMCYMNFFSIFWSKGILMCCFHPSSTRGTQSIPSLMSCCTRTMMKVTTTISLKTWF